MSNRKVTRSVVLAAAIASSSARTSKSLALTSRYRRSISGRLPGATPTAGLATVPGCWRTRDRSPGSKDLELCLCDLLWPNLAMEADNWSANASRRPGRDWVKLCCDRRTDHCVHRDGLLARPSLLRR